MRLSLVMNQGLLHHLPFDAGESFIFWAQSNKLQIDSSFHKDFFIPNSIKGNRTVGVDNGVVLIDYAGIFFCVTPSATDGEIWARVFIGCFAGRELCKFVEGFLHSTTNSRLGGRIVSVCLAV